jgi:DNA-binding transcriptional ArsR family regulator
MASKKRINTQAILSALKHPMRRQILRLMKDGERISPSELMAPLEQSLSNVSYHVRVLAEYGVIEAAGHQQVRGATQHFYRWALEAEWAKELLDESEPPPKKKKKGKPKDPS